MEKYQYSIEEIVKLLNSNDLKLIEKETCIPYDRMFKWKSGRSKPKLDDYNTLSLYFNGKKSRNDGNNSPESVEKQIHEVKPLMEAVPVNIGFDPDEYQYKGEKFLDLPDGSIMMWVPRIPAKVQAGYLLGYHDPEYFDDMVHEPVNVQKRHSGHYVIFDVTGDSMVPPLTPENETLIREQAIWPGWSVLSRELPKRQWQYKLHTHYVDTWVIAHKTDGILVKNIKHHDTENGLITIHSLNPAYEDRILSLNDIEQIFSVYRRLPPQY